MLSLRFPLLLVFVLLMASCGDQPKVIESTAENTGTTEGSSVLDEITNSASSTTEHHVEVVEVLHTEKYSYLQVKEGEESHWIAIPKSEVEVGDHLVYRGGLMKKNFLSREYNRVFETLFLVSDIQKMAPEGATVSGGGIPGDHPAIEPPTSITPAAGATGISELVKNAKKYEGKTVKVTGKVVKVNPMIMNRNWIHIQDGTGDNQDLTVTTAENIPLGAIVTVEGTIALNKDFGAGYRYDLIMEGAVVVK
ncbi:MAG: GW dipeptide domain-containing protein [Saprospiraceae bacterium]|nr:GW dipeptide domain-containing protein [Saprospiraceae bacterium]